MQVVSSGGDVLISHAVQPGDVWRACQTKDASIRDWVKLAVTRARASGTPAVFWLDETRAHDANLIEKVNTYLQHHDTSGLDISIATPADACAISPTFGTDPIVAGSNAPLARQSSRTTW